MISIYLYIFNLRGENTVRFQKMMLARCLKFCRGQAEFHSLGVNIAWPTSRFEKLDR